MQLLAGDPRHGTMNGYTNHGCRCEACRQANTARHRAWRYRTGYTKPLELHLAAVKAAADARENHGTEQRYKPGCRCDVCRAGAAAARRRRRDRERTSADAC